MAKTLTEIFNETATAIQEKTGKSEPIPAANFGEEIENISTAPETTIMTEGKRIGLDLAALKQILPQAILNTRFNYYTASGSYLQLTFTNGGTISSNNNSLYLASLVNTFISSHQIYNNYCNLFIDLSQQIHYSESGPETFNVYFTDADNGEDVIHDVVVYNGITLSELIDNIITANGSNIFMINTGFDAILGTPLVWHIVNGYNWPTYTQLDINKFISLSEWYAD